MNVLHVTASASLGGGSEHLWLLVRHLAEYGIRSYVASPRDYPYWPRFAACVGEDRMLAIPHRRFRLGALLQLALFARRHRIDVLHSHGKGAGLYVRLARIMTGIPCVHTYHGIHRGSMGEGAWRLYCLLERAFGRLTQTAISVSPGEREQILHLGYCPSDRLCLIPNGVLCPPHDPETGRAPQQRRDIVHVTRFDPDQKNSEAVVDVAAALDRAGRLARFRFVMLGDGPRRQAVEDLAQERGLAGQFYFAGAVASTRPYLREAFCVLSTSRWEGLPLALLEAMAEGVPVVASRVVGNCDAVRDQETGFLFNLADPAQAAAGILALDDDPARWHLFATAAAAYAAQHYNACSMARLTAAAYRQNGAQSAGSS